MAVPEDQNKNVIRSIKVYFENLSVKRKRLVILAAAGLVLVAAALTFFLNTKDTGYRVLYTGMDPAEVADVYAAVQNLGVVPELDGKGQILVPESRYEYLLLQLASKGYPKSTLAYDVFLNNAGMTATEADKKQILLFQLQNRIQDTLRRIEGVESAVVNLTVPDNNDNVWLLATNDQVATAGVMLTLGKDVALIPEQVGAIKNLVAFSVPKMDPSNVKVVDATTGLELEDLESVKDVVGSSHDALQLESTFQDHIEKNVRRILVPWYGEQGVFVVARVTLDLDKMMSEKMELLNKVGPEGEDLGGFTTHHVVEGVKEGVGNVAGIVGEENNTDIPTYQLQGPAGNEDYAHYYGSIDYDYGYLKTQVEKGNAYIKRGTVSVIVDEKSLTEERRAEIVDIISKSADIAPEFIALSALNPPPPAIEPIEPIENIPEEAVEVPFWVYIAVGAALLLIVILVVVFILLRRRAARLAREREKALKAQQEDMENEIERYKQELANAAKATVNAKDDAITGEIRQFARDNPEITANLLRNWLKEGDS
ncbi:MAG: flagellar basal-body MS-ring/collar protein FliF [Clostridiales bacterium]